MLRKRLAARLKFTVVYERDEHGWWVASIPAVPGCHTQGRTVAQARERIREALEVALDRPDAERAARDAELLDDVRLPAGVTEQIEASRSARARAAAEEERAQAATRTAVVALTKRLGLSLRDAAELLGLSHQRVQQLARAAPAARKRTAA
jgi:predicted RNase H-like HicB family nuclease